MKRRLLVSYLSITAFVLLVLEVPLGVSYTNSVERRLLGDLQHDAFALAIRAQDPMERGSSDASLAAALDALVRDYLADTGARAVVVDRDGLALADARRPSIAAQRVDYSSRPQLQRALGGAESSGKHYSEAMGEDVLYVALPIGSADGIRGALRLTISGAVVSDEIEHIWVLLAATGGVVLGIVFLVSLIMARSVTRPLADLQTAAVGLGGGDLSVRAGVPTGPAEIRVLADSFNTTAARLEKLVGAQRAFVADASHQLRTPLAALRLRLENLEAEVDVATAEDLEGALAEVRRLTRLVDGLLVLARTEHSGSTPVPVDLVELLDGRCDAWSAFAAEREVRLDVTAQGELWARLTPGRLEQVVDNLLNNALEVAPAASAVRVHAARVGAWLEVRVVDEGPGMSEEQRLRAFDRFWQAPGARRDGRAAGHFGLGLPIVRELVTADGGDVTLAEAATGGLEVVVRLRPADSPAPRQLSTVG